MAGVLETLKLQFDSLQNNRDNARSIREQNYANMDNALMSDPLNEVIPELNAFLLAAGKMGGVPYYEELNKLRQNKMQNRLKSGMLKEALYKDLQDDYSDLLEKNIQYLSKADPSLAKVNGFTYDTFGSDKVGRWTFNRSTGEKSLAVPPSWFAERYGKISDDVYQEVLKQGVITDPNEIERVVEQITGQRAAREFANHPLGQKFMSGISQGTYPGNMEDGLSTSGTPSAKTTPVNPREVQTFGQQEFEPVQETMLPDLSKESSLNSVIGDPQLPIQLPEQYGSRVIDGETEIDIEAEMLANRIQRNGKLFNRLSDTDPDKPKIAEQIRADKNRMAQLEREPVGGAATTSVVHPRTSQQPAQAFVGGTGEIPTYSMTPEQRANREQAGKDAQKEYEETKSSLTSIRNMAPSIDAMKAVLSNPKLANVGPLHDQLTKLGGYMSYIDKDSTLAQSVNNTPAYFSNMMNLVRDKIKALGSGTAVSNLDLIVTQKSVGDLRNTTEGNKKLLALMELQNATLADRMSAKVSYYENSGNSFKGYEGKIKDSFNEPSHIIRRDPDSGEYYIQSRNDWIAEKARLMKKNPQEIASYWKREANKATRLMLNGVPGVEFGSSFGT